MEDSKIMYLEHEKRNLIELQNITEERITDKLKHEVWLVGALES